MTADRPPEMPRPLAAVRQATRRTLAEWKAHITYGVVVAVIGGLILAPAGSWLVVRSLGAAGGSVVNTGIASLVFSFRGLAVLALAATLVGMIVVISGAGHAYLAAGAILQKHPTVRDVARRVLADLPRVPGVGGVKLAFLSALGAPLLGAAVTGLAALVLVPIGGFEDLRRVVPRGLPVPLWMVAAGMGVLVVVFSWLYVRWSLAIATFALERVSLSEAMKASTRRTQGVFWRIGLAHLAHHLTIAIAFSLIIILLRLAARPILVALFDRSETAGMIGLAVVLAFFWAVAGAFGILATSRLVSLTVIHHLATGGTVGAAGAPPIMPARRLRLGLPILAITGAVAFAATIWLAIPRVKEELRQAARATVVTAHRAGPIDAPENTLAALRRATLAGAHSAEIDVQQAKDGALVVVHDPNLKRLAGVDKNVPDLTATELAALDVGAHHSAAFRGEKIPSLEQMMDAAKDRIVLNIELKTNGKENAAFIPDFVALVRKKDFIDRCFVTSLEAPFVTEVRKLEPRLRVGIIITAKVGSGEDLDVDLYSVQPIIATSDFIRRAHAKGREVHVWTINERPEMSRFADRGADALITDAPLLAREVLDARTTADGLRGAARRLFGLD